MKRVYYKDDQNKFRVKLSEGQKIDKTITEYKNKCKVVNLSAYVIPVLRDLESFFVNHKRYKQYL